MRYGDKFLQLSQTYLRLKVEMSQLTISRRQVGRSLPFKQNFFGSLQQTVEWDTFLKCAQF